MEHLRLVLGGATQQMLMVQFNEVVWIAVFKELGAIETALGHSTHEFAHTQIAVFEQRLHLGESLTLHQILVAQYLFVDGTNQSGLVLLGTDRPVLLVAVIGKSLDAEIGGIDKRHGGTSKGVGGLAAVIR